MSAPAEKTAALSASLVQPAISESPAQPLAGEGAGAVATRLHPVPSSDDRVRFI